MESLLRFVEQSVNSSVTALEHVQHNSHVAYLQLLQSENPAAKQLVKVITHPTVVSVSSSAYHTVIDSRIANYFKNNPQHAVIALFFVLRTIVLPALIKKKPLQVELPEDKNEDMVDFGLGNGAAGGKGENGEVEVQFGKEKLRVSLPPPNSPLSALKADLFNRTGIQPDHQKLIFNGAILKDDLAPLSSFGLVDDSATTDPSAPTSFWDQWSLTSRFSSKKLKKLILLGTQPAARVDNRLSSRADLVAAAAAEAAAEAAGPPPPESEEVFMEKMKGLLDGENMTQLEGQLSEVEKWTEQEKRRQKGEPAVAEGEEELEKPNPRTLIFLSEAFLQNLLKLDSFDVPQEYAEARKERKAGVRRVQALLDRTDAAKQASKGLL